MEENVIAFQPLRPEAGASILQTPAYLASQRKEELVMLSPKRGRQTTADAGPEERNAVRSAGEAIRKYCIEHHIITVKYDQGRPAICLLAIYGIIALVVFLGSLWLERMQCDPMFTDRGLTVACRNAPFRWERPSDLFAQTPIGY